MLFAVVVVVCNCTTFCYLLNASLAYTAYGYFIRRLFDNIAAIQTLQEELYYELGVKVTSLISVFTVVPAI